MRESSDKLSGMRRPIITAILRKPRRGFRALFIIAITALIFAGSAFGQSFADDCGGANNLDPATCERVDYLANQSDAEIRLLGWIVGVSLFGITTPIFRGVLGRNS